VKKLSLKGKDTPTEDNKSKSMDHSSTSCRSAAATGYRDMGGASGDVLRNNEIGRDQTTG